MPVTGLLLPLAVTPGFPAARDQQHVSASARTVVVVHKAKPRHRLTIGDQWRVRCSQLPLQQQDPTWSKPETWVFAVTGVEQTADGQRLIVTATREGAAKPTVKLQLDPASQAVLRADTQVPVPGGFRDFVERPAPGEPFVSEVSPVPIALPAPEVSPTVAKADSLGPAAKTESPEPAAGDGPALAFSFGQRFHQKTDPVDASVGQAKIQRGMEPLRRRREAGLEPTGIPRYVTVIDGPGARIDEVWDDTTPWPLYSETQASRCWLVDYKKRM
jgi:hypothetical protein